MSRREIHVPAGRQFDLSGPDGNVFFIAGLAQSWNQQLGLTKRGSILKATTARLLKEDEWSLRGDYNDVLDTFDAWFKGKIPYEFLNDPRDPSTSTEEEDCGDY